ncbi:MAG: radical SAM protein [Methermicoccaceae archaeon]
MLMPSLKLVAWETTGACNLACTYCRASASLNPSPDELTLDEAKILIDGVSEFGASLIITGGEPLLRPDMPKILEYANGKLTILFSTNGTLINSSVAKMLGKANVKRVSISLDGATQATHERFRGEGTF